MEVVCINPIIKIGVIGPASFSSKLYTAFAQFPSFKPIYMLSDDIDDAPVYTDLLAAEVDVLLFSGHLPYSLSKNRIPVHLPAHHIPLKGTGLFKALYLLKSAAATLARLSVDCLSPGELRSVLHELEEESFTIIHRDRDILDSTEQLVRFHEDAYRNSGTSGALTHSKAVSDILTSKGIVNQWIVPTVDDIVNTLERALLSTEKRRNQEAQMVCGIIRIENKMCAEGKNNASNPSARLDKQIQRRLLDYIEQFDGHLTSVSSSEYIFVTTRGAFERVTEGYRTMPVIDDIRKKLQLQLSIGIGFGLTANEAGIHSELALRQAQDYGSHSCFIVREDRSVIGPIQKERPLTYPLSFTDKTLLEEAEQAGVTPFYLQKLFSLLKRKEKNAFTANELANTLAITQRSAHRIISKCLDAGIFSIIGEEKMTARGRPRQIFHVEKWDKTF